MLLILLVNDPLLRHINVTTYSLKIQEQKMICPVRNGIVFVERQILSK